MSYVKKPRVTVPLSDVPTEIPKRPAPAPPPPTEDRRQLGLFRKLVAEIKATNKSMQGMGQGRALITKPETIGAVVWYLTRSNDQFTGTETAGFHAQRKGGMPATRKGLSGLTGEQWVQAFSDRSRPPDPMVRKNAIEGAVRYVLRIERRLKNDGKQIEPKAIVAHYLYGQIVTLPPDHDAILKLAKFADPNTLEIDMGILKNVKPLMPTTIAPTLPPLAPPLTAPSTPANTTMVVTKDGIETRLAAGVEDES